MYHSQFDQDKYVAEQIYPGKRDGVFVDLGAFDGVIISNTLFFEQELGWTGLCVEPVPAVFARLRANRACACAQVAVADADGELEMDSPEGSLAVLSSFRASADPRHTRRLRRESAEQSLAVRTIRVPVRAVTPLLLEHGLRRVDYLSIDVESAELPILRSLDFDAISVGCIGVENDYHGDAIEKILVPRGFRKVGVVGCDEFYLRP